MVEELAQEGGWDQWRPYLLDHIFCVGQKSNTTSTDLRSSIMSPSHEKTSSDFTAIVTLSTWKLRIGLLVLLSHGIPTISISQPSIFPFHMSRIMYMIKKSMQGQFYSDPIISVFMYVVRWMGNLPLKTTLCPQKSLCQRKVVMWVNSKTESLWSIF